MESLKASFRLVGGGVFPGFLRLEPELSVRSESRIDIDLGKNSVICALASTQGVSRATASHHVRASVSVSTVRTHARPERSTAFCRAA